ncbi:hypothetical protein O181_045602 [Austropuccinia psidii MF-1]|uniref:Reverse transcriptase domain-containing protein n=1 Tax=Austropuccinia psidii MF-1 TaxID=1389203 RepID=A0A9Q3HIW0_9BASI|nr:hypothetical protein [Austropuccinia psidii MF-1]
MSLLSSRDEVFGDIQDVEEDNSVSSLNLLFGNMDLPPSSYHDSLQELWDEEEESEEIDPVMKVFPSSYHYQESDKLRAYTSENLEKGFIQPSSPSTGEPVLFVKKKDSGPDLCVDHRKLNAVTRKNRYCVPPMNQLLTLFNGSSISSKIDLCGAYKLLIIKEGDEHLTASRPKYGSYEDLVMQFGLTNSPSSFQRIFNVIFHDIINVYVVVYLDYIMVFSKYEEENVTSVSIALSRFRANNIFAKASKCLIHFSSAEYLGYIVSCEGPQDGPRKGPANFSLTTSKKPQGS